MSQCVRKEFQLSTFQGSYLAQGQCSNFCTFCYRNWDPQVTFLTILCSHYSVETPDRLSSATVYACSGAADKNISFFLSSFLSFFLSFLTFKFCFCVLIANWICRLQINLERGQQANPSSLKQEEPSGRCL